MKTKSSSGQLNSTFLSWFSHLCFHGVWASCYWVSSISLSLLQGWSWVCACECAFVSVQYWSATAKRIKESEQACTRLCHVINIVLLYVSLAKWDNWTLHALKIHQCWTSSLLPISLRETIIITNKNVLIIFLSIKLQIRALFIISIFIFFLLAAPNFWRNPMQLGRFEHLKCENAVRHASWDFFYSKNCCWKQKHFKMALIHHHSIKIKGGRDF